MHYRIKERRSGRYDVYTHPQLPLKCQHIPLPDPPEEVRSVYDSSYKTL